MEIKAKPDENLPELSELLVEIVVDGIPMVRLTFGWINPKQRLAYVALNEKERREAVRWIKEALECEFLNDFHKLWSSAMALGDRYCPMGEYSNIVLWEGQQRQALAEKQGLLGDGEHLDGFTDFIDSLNFDQEIDDDFHNEE